MAFPLGGRLDLAARQSFFKVFTNHMTDTSGCSFFSLLCSCVYGVCFVIIDF